MSAAEWAIAAVIAAAAFTFALARYLWYRDAARWNAPGCRWCNDRKSPRGTPCTCGKPCGRTYCKAPDAVEAEHQQLLEQERGGHG